MGPIVAYKTCAQERCIGKFSSVITGKVRTNVQASNLIETVAIGNRLKRTFNANDFLQGIRPNSYSEDSYINHQNNLTRAQLWEPIEEINLSASNLSDHFQNVPISKIKRAINKFYCRLFSVQQLDQNALPIINKLYCCW